MAYNKIGIVGATGPLGQELTRALVDEGYDVVPFSRQTTTVAGIRTQQLSSLVGFDVVISVVGHRGMKEQVALIQQAKRDGVKRFVPSEFGIDPRAPAAQADLFQPKRENFATLKAANFTDGWTAISCGFLDSVIPAFATFEPAAAKVNIRGSGDTKYPYTVRRDIGRILAHTFKHPKQYKDKWIAVANDWLSLREIAEIIKAKSGNELLIETVDLDDSTPVLRLLEENGWTTFRREDQTKDLPVKLADLRDHINI
ncbi:NmrA-like family protein [Paraphaeosphaeria sporulosa]